TLGDCRLRGAVTIGIALIPIGTRDCWQSGAPVANDARLFGDGEPRVERPIGNINVACGSARDSERGESFMFERVGYDGLQDSAGSTQRQVIIFLFEGAPAIDVGLLDNGAELG